VRQPPNYTRTTQAPPGGSRVVAGHSRFAWRENACSSRNRGRSRLCRSSSLPACHAGGRGSSPVAPVNPLQSGIFWVGFGANDRRLFSSRAHPAPEIAGQSRLEPLIPAGQMTGHIAGRPPTAGRRMSHFQRFRRGSRALRAPHACARPSRWARHSYAASCAERVDLARLMRSKGRQPTGRRRSIRLGEPGA
jgi:hypothetical protein